MSLERVLEPEVMDTLEEAQDYNEMDHSHVNQVFVTELLEFAAGHQVELGDVLDLGTGTALIPIELCKRHSTCRVMAIDMAINMLELARYNVEAEGLIDRITLAKVDAKAMPYETSMFQTLISNSIVHHIPEPLHCLAEGVRVTEPGGLVFVRDLLRPNSSEEVSRLVELYAGDENDHSKKMFDDSLRASLSLEEIRAVVEELGFDPQTVQATTDRHWTWSAIKPSVS